MSFAEFAAGAWSTSDLLSDIRRKARLSDTDEDYTDAVLLREATDVLITRIARAHTLAREGRRLLEAEREVASEAVSEDGRSFVLPPWAMGDALSRVFWRPSTDSMDDERPLDYVGADLEPEALEGYEEGDPWGYTLVDNRVRLIPGASGGALRFLYPRRHGQLVPSTSVRQVDSVDVQEDGSTVIELASAAPASWVEGAWVDIYGGTPPHTVFCADARVADGSSGTTLAVAVPYATLGPKLNAEPTRLYVALSGESGHVHVPLEFRPALTSLVAANVLRNLGFIPDANDRESEGLRILGEGQDLITPRNKGTREKIVNRNSLLRGASRRRGGGGWL